MVSVMCSVPSSARFMATATVPAGSSARAAPRGTRPPSLLASGAVERAFVIADLPFGTYEASPEQALASAVRLVKAGANQVDGPELALDRPDAALDEALGHPSHDPHGDPIPQPDGTVPTPDACLLSELAAGQSGTVARISDSDPEMLRYFQEVGIAPDARIEVVELRKFLGTVAVTVDDGAPLDLGDVAAQAIWVRS